MEDDSLVIGGEMFESRLLLGTGGVPSLEVLERAIVGLRHPAGDGRAAPGRGVDQRRRCSRCWTGARSGCCPTRPAA